MTVLFLEPRIGFAHSSYVVHESEGFVSVEVRVLNGERGTNATFRVTTVSGTAVGMEHSVLSNVVIIT